MTEVKKNQEGAKKKRRLTAKDFQSAVRKAPSRALFRKIMEDQEGSSSDKMKKD